MTCIHHILFLVRFTQDVIIKFYSFVIFLQTCKDQCMWLWRGNVSHRAINLLASVRAIPIAEVFARMKVSKKETAMALSTVAFV
jgi:hypothetical protein